MQQSKYKVMNKDQWCNVLEFSRTINLDLSNYDEDGACEDADTRMFTPHTCSHASTLDRPGLVFCSVTGPVLLDEFVEWYKDRQMS